MSDLEHQKDGYAGEKAIPIGTQEADISPGYMEEMPENFEEVGHMKQGLHQRHIQMIALAGTIGTGLFLGSGAALAKAGPLGALMG
jgi:yeast amino acid transporter